MMLPICILGLALPVVVNNYIHIEFNRINENILNKTRDITQAIFNSFNAVNLVLSGDQRMVFSLNKIFNESRSFDDTDLLKVSDLTNFVNSFIATTPVIDSVYVYIKNDSGRFYSSSHGITRIDDFLDKNWFEYLDNLDIYGNVTNQRMIKRYGFETRTKEIVSVYRKLFTNEGVVVLNIDAEKLRAAISKFSYQNQQSIIIADEKSGFSLYNENDYLTKDFAENIMADSRPDFIYNHQQIEYVVSKRPLTQNHWVFISVIPRKNMYTLQYKLVTAIALAVVICLVMGILMSLRVVNKNYRNINGILLAIEAAESGEFYEELPSHNDAYYYIIRNIIQNGILKRYLEVQLSEKKYMMKNLELTTLQCQINPHFLVNTLKTIYWKSVSTEGMEGELPQMIENLSDVVGYSLADPRTLVNMSIEIFHTQSFIDILKARHSGEFSVIWAYKEDILKIKTEKIVLQPIIENAFYHGLRPCKNMGAVKIKIYIKDTIVIIKVIDNGVGMSKEHLNDLRNSLQAKDSILTEHIGLANTHKRIQLKFGEEYGISIRSKEGLGTSVCLVFPLIRED